MPSSVWSPGSPLPMSCSKRADQQQVRPVDVAGERGRVGRGLDEVPVDREAVVRVALRPAADVAPVRQQPDQHARPGRAPRTPARPAARRRAVRRTPPGPRAATAPASAALSVASRSKRVRRERQVGVGAARARAARRTRIGVGSAGVTGQRHLAVLLDDALVERRGGPALRPRDASVAGLTLREARYQAVSHAQAMVRPASATGVGERLGVRQVRAPARRPPAPAAAAGRGRCAGAARRGRPAGRVRGRGTRPPGTSATQAAASARSASMSRSPPRAILQVRFEQEGDLAVLARAFRDRRRRSSGSRLARRRPPARPQLRAESGGQVGVAGDVAGVEQPQRRLQVLVGDRDRLGDGPDAVVERRSARPRSGTRPGRRRPRCPCVACRRARARGRGRCPSAGSCRPYAPDRIPARCPGPGSPSRPVSQRVGGLDQRTPKGRPGQDRTGPDLVKTGLAPKCALVLASQSRV